MPYETDNDQHEYCPYCGDWYTPDGGYGHGCSQKRDYKEEQEFLDELAELQQQ